MLIGPPVYAKKEKKFRKKRHIFYVLEVTGEVFSIIFGVLEKIRLNLGLFGKELF